MPLDPFRPNWHAEILAKPPMIAPARQFTYPMAVPGEEDAIARGALQLFVHPATGGTFLATCALGFADPGMPTGVHPCPNPDHLCAVAGGYAYLIDTLHPEPGVSTHISVRPVVEVRPLLQQRVLIFIGFHSLACWDETGLRWKTQRLSWEGIRLTGADEDKLYGFGWSMLTDKEVAFSVDIHTGGHVGGGYQA